MDTFAKNPNSPLSFLGKVKNLFSGQRIVVLVSQHHELYLPLYYALWRKSFFHRVRQRLSLLLWRVEISVNTIDKYSRGEGSLDDAVYKTMMDNGGTANAGNQDIYLAITDPTQIFKAKLTDEHLPAVLAPIVTNGGFWAVEHHKKAGQKTRHPTRHPNDAVENVKLNMSTIVENYDQILAYEKGTTSYRVAQAIQGYGEKKLKISKLTEDKKTREIRFDTGNQRTIALSPNILSILAQEHKGELHNIMHLNQTGEFDNIISSALMGRSDIVNENTFFVGYIVREIEYAVKQIHKLSNTKRGKQELVKFMKYLVDRYRKLAN